MTSDSPLCNFNIVLEGVIRGAVLNKDIRGTILYRFLQLLRIADDIYIYKRTAARIGLRINATKTKYLLAGDSDHPGSSVLVDGDNLQVVKEFCYLRTVVTLDNDISSEFRRRFVQGNRAYYGASPTVEIRKTSSSHEM